MNPLNSRDTLNGVQRPPSGALAPALCFRYSLRLCQRGAKRFPKNNRPNQFQIISYWKMRRHKESRRQGKPNVLKKEILLLYLYISCHQKKCQKEAQLSCSSVYSTFLESKITKRTFSIFTVTQSEEVTDFHVNT